MKNCDCVGENADEKEREKKLRTSTDSPARRDLPRGTTAPEKTR